MSQLVRFAFACSVVAAVSGLHAQDLPTTRPLVYEAEAYSTPKTAWLPDKLDAAHWNLWSTDKDAAKKWSGGVVLQAPPVKADRKSSEEGVPALHTRVTGIPRGRYEVEIKLGRVLGVSRDGKTWEKKTGSNPSLGVVDIQDGTFELWVDDRYAAEGAPGSSYYDCLIFNPVLPRVEKPKLTGFAATRVREKLDRGLVAVPAGKEGTHVSWRLLESDAADVAFNVYRVDPGQAPRKLNAAPLAAATSFVDPAGGAVAQYVVKRVTGGGDETVAGPVAVWGSDACAVIKLDPGTTVQKVGIGDLDGDGCYDYVIKTPQDNIDPGATWWTPSPDTYKVQAYTHDGRRLWSRDLGWSIERGIWYSPMLVFDFDGDGRAEVALKTGTGDPRGADGRVESGPEWISILDGTTGEELARDDWPSRQAPGEKYNYNYASRNQMCVAYLDGKTPYLIVERGTYTTIRLVAYEFVRGKGLRRAWAWDSREEAGRGRYNAQGAHILHAADIDGDGRDEVIIGSAVVDDNGNGLWTTGLGHPDYCFVGDIDPARPGLEIFYGIEPRQPKNGLCVADAKTGQILWGLDVPTGHVGTNGMCADVDDQYPGSECYAADLDGQRKYARSWLFSAAGRLLSEQRQTTMSQPVYWDADPQRELLRGANVCDFRGGGVHPPKITGRLVAIADVVGDWREEIITSSPGELRIYTTPIPATSRVPCLMQDPIYRIDVAVAFMGYYAAPMLSYDMATRTRK